jgi:hypothetical protein
MRGKLLLLVFVLAFAVPTFAGSIDIDFGTGLAGAGGVYNLLPGGNASGSNIPIGVMTIAGDGLYNGVYPVTGTCSGGSGCLSFDTTASTIAINGAIPSMSVGGTLLSGNILSFVLDEHFGIYGFTANGNDTKNPDLLTAIGLPADQAFNYFGFTLGTTSSAGGLVPISTDIANTTTTPEPVSMLLMGTFFSLAGGLLSKKKRA